MELIFTDYISRRGAERQIVGTVICVINVVGMIGHGG